MKRRSEVVQVKRNAMRLMAQRRGLDQARKLRRDLDQLKFLGVEQIEVGRRIGRHPRLRRLALQRGDPRMRILDVEYRIIL